jgi:hypothetical protein
METAVESERICVVVLGKSCGIVRSYEYSARLVTCYLVGRQEWRSKHCPYAKVV